MFLMLRKINDPINTCKDSSNIWGSVCLAAWLTRLKQGIDRDRNGLSSKPSFVMLL